ncbi:hypothetical protein SHKM778_29300 [Streptomyces sp. KM77-8]|uniref:ABC-type glycine betaine transport system substrate-binding domain-containing protein n=1 Tax=Streptomyces haneummycinicus TaxID=3074435 RepID=A0AAT9HGQ3_9ACTN
MNPWIGSANDSYREKQQVQDEVHRRGGCRARRGGAARGLFLLRRHLRQPLDGEKAEAGTVVVGSNNFAESTLLADIYGEALRAKGLKVDYKHNIGSRETTYGLMKNGSITVLPEYNGSSSPTSTRRPGRSRPRR